MSCASSVSIAKCRWSIVRSPARMRRLTARIVMTTTSLCDVMLVPTSSVQVRVIARALKITDMKLTDMKLTDMKMQDMFQVSE